MRALLVALVLVSALVAGGWTRAMLAPVQGPHHPPPLPAADAYKRCQGLTLEDRVDCVLAVSDDALRLPSSRSTLPAVESDVVQGEVGGVGQDDDPALTALGE